MQYSCLPHGVLMHATVSLFPAHATVSTPSVMCYTELVSHQVLPKLSKEVCPLCHGGPLAPRLA